MPYKEARLTSCGRQVPSVVGTKGFEIAEKRHSGSAWNVTNGTDVIDMRESLSAPCKYNGNEIVSSRSKEPDATCTKLSNKAKSMDFTDNVAAPDIHPIDRSGAGSRQVGLGIFTQESRFGILRQDSFDPMHRARILKTVQDALAVRRGKYIGGAKPATIVRMNTPLSPSVSVLLPLILSVLSPFAFAFPATQENAELTLNFALSPLDPLSTASGTASINVMRLAGVEYDDAMVLSLSGLPDGTYTVEATTKSDPAAPPILIGSVIVSAIVDPAAPPAPPLTLPEGLNALDIATLTISDATPAVILAGEATEDVANWRFFGNRPLVPAPDSTTSPPHKLHGHVLIRAAIVEGGELRRKFLLVGHGLPPRAP